MLAEANTTDYRFLEASGFNKEYRDLPQMVVTPDMVPIATAFMENMDSVAVLCTGLVKAVFWSAVWGRLTTTERDFSDPIWFFDRNYQAWEMQEPYTRFKQFTETLTPDEAERQFLLIGNAYLHDQQRHMETANALRSVMYAMILNAYAAFETLATDLWATAVDLQPSRYLRYKGSEDEKMVSIKHLRGFNDDLRSHLGRFLVASQTVSFLNSESIKKNYSLCFHKDSDPIKAFSSTVDLVVTEQTRHLIAHRGGRMDARFRAFATEKNLALLKDLPLGTPLPLIGPNVRDMIEPCVKAATNLVLGVDKEIGQYVPPA